MNEHIRDRLYHHQWAQPLPPLVPGVVFPFAAAFVGSWSVASCLYLHTLINKSLSRLSNHVLSRDHRFELQINCHTFRHFYRKFYVGIEKYFLVKGSCCSTNSFLQKQHNIAHTSYNTTTYNRCPFIGRLKLTEGNSLLTVWYYHLVEDCSCCSPQRRVPRGIISI